MLFLLALIGCNSPHDTAPLYDTGWWSAVDDSGRCVDQLKKMTPAEGEQAWYRRRPLIVTVETELVEAYRIALVDLFGRAVPVDISWVGARATVTPKEPLQPDTDYLLQLTDCDGQTDRAFRTSAYGLPLEVPPASLNRRSFVLKMDQAVWEKPANFGTIVSLYFSTPILIGVQWANADNLDLIGAMGYLDTLGAYRQQMNSETWDFPMADFSQSPYFEAHTDQIAIRAQGIPVDIYDFKLSGTLAADGRSLGGVRISGFGDTRNMGEFIGKKGVPGAMCELAFTWNVPCIPCPDGGGYCMEMDALDMNGALVEGLQLQQVGAR